VLVVAYDIARNQLAVPDADAVAVNGLVMNPTLFVSTSVQLVLVTNVIRISAVGIVVDPIASSSPCVAGVPFMINSLLLT
jgi:hypothetical protein